MISLRQRVLWASLMASAAFAASAQQPAPAAAPAPTVLPAQVQASPAAPAEPAQSAPSGSRRAEGRKGERDPAQRYERMNQRQQAKLVALKGKLQLNAQQESAWNGYAEALKLSRPANAQPRLSRDAFRQLTTPERLDRMQALQAERSARFTRHAEATRSFYAQLTPEQQKTFDAETLRAHGKRHHGKRHERGERGERGERHEHRQGGDKPAAPATN